MTVHSVRATTPTSTDSATRQRVALLAVVLGTTAVAAIFGGLLWPEPSGGGETYTYADIADQRDLWWGLLMGLAVLAVCNVPLQAIAVMLLVHERGSLWATIGGALMWLGIGAQAAGGAAWAATYFYATDPSVDTAAGTAVVEAANADQLHLFAFMIPGALLVLIGTVLQCVALFRAHVVPVWVPIAALTVVLTFFVPGNGWLGVITSIPMAAASVALGYYAWRRVANG